MKLSNDSKTKEIINNTLKNGGIIAFVTDTVWGLGCLPNNEDAVQKIYSLKNRDTSKPLILMSNQIEYLMPYIKDVSKNAKKQIEKHFPGALTLIFNRTEKTPLYITSGKDTVGIRIPDNKIFKKLCEIIDGKVLATTSANISGQTPAMSYQEAYANLSSMVDIIIEDEYEKPTGAPSTVACITDEETVIYREGSVKL